ncbi:MAG TPA: SIMPL domain-containing protein, partial [Solirubrobacteraceae bacterium]|nr:SIMPL domain-containing protein [Solirubrobacteraceae bacterium]
AAIRARGVDAADIRTDVVSLDRRAVKAKTHYVARNAVAVTIRALERAGAIVDAGVRAGATNVYGPEFGVSDGAARYRDALGLALADARAKAERMARDAGVTLGAVLRIHEGGDHYDDDGQFNVSGGGGSGDGPPIARGRTQISASVTVTFAVSDGA